MCTASLLSRATIKEEEEGEAMKFLNFCGSSLQLKHLNVAYLHYGVSKSLLITMYLFK